MISVMLGGFIGTFIRYAITEGMKGRTSFFPSAVLFINLAGSFLIGLMAGIGLNAASPEGRLIFTGCLGAFTTFSTFSVETVQLWKEKRLSTLTVYLLLSLLGSVMLCLTAYWLGQAFK